jgi:DNA-binding transcriptional LysR family regulator
MTIDELFLRGLNLEKLRSFLEVAQAGSVTKAAKGIQSRRSLMSRQIGELEKTLGFDVFSRNGRIIEINEAGRELALLTASFFAEFEGVAKRGNQSETLLKIGAGTAAFEALVFPNLLALEKEFPGSIFEFCPSSTSEVIEALHAGRIDLGIVRLGMNFQGIGEIAAGNLPFVIVGRRDFDTNLASWSAKTFLSRVPISIIRGEGQWVESFRRFCFDFEVEPRITHRVETFGHVRELMKAGAPGGILPSSLADELPSSHFATIDTEALAPITRPLAVVYDIRASKVRDHLESMAGALAKVIRENAS